MVKNVAEIVCILDRSGSMRSLVDSTISNFNEFIQKQRLDGPGQVTLVLFDDQYEVIYENMALSMVPDLTRDVYFDRGMTRLMDAVGKTIARVKERHLNDRPDKTMFLIITDGQENDSQEYTESGTIKEMVGECIDDLNWEFFYLGANVDAFAEAGNMGIPSVYAANYDPSNIGTKRAYATASAAMSGSRSSSAGGQSLSEGKTLSDLYDDQESEDGKTE